MRDDQSFRTLRVIRFDFGEDGLVLALQADQPAAEAVAEAQTVIVDGFIERAALIGRGC